MLSSIYNPELFSGVVGLSLHLAAQVAGLEGTYPPHPPRGKLRGTVPQYPKSELISLSPCTATSSPSQNLAPVHAKNNVYISRKTKITATVDGDLGIPTLMSKQDAYAKKSRKPKIAAVVSGCVGATLLVVITLLLVYVCLMRVKRFVRRTSETGSSSPSPPVDWVRENVSPHAGVVSLYETGNLRQLTILELEHATFNFSESNVIGEGGFGLVYKGLLQDGSIVAIKRRIHEPSQSFVCEVENIGCIHHRHLVKLIGFCQENHQQLLVYEFLPNGNVGKHLYDSEGFPIRKLDIRQRLSIAIGAAKGLEYLHCLVPPFLHMHFRMRNVLVDDNFAVKVSDFGLSKLVVDGNRAGSSSDVDYFLDPELRLSNEYSPRSDVYSFGVFFLELISGREALDRNQSEPSQNLVTQAMGTSSLDDFVDSKLREKSATAAMQRMMELALLCLDTGIRRPTMKMVVRELELIQEREMGHQETVPGEEISVVTLGSELFK
ncbi:Protein kinase domain [Macleaya cordata]|uniref:non-specific serine/threonine protein kinase n=1 Tax=Macleaya cordata TaxID=56857 RepID=A0A200R5T4_MACCD|nr:Protein kinase domain [Macleaya cordata]